MLCCFCKLYYVYGSKYIKNQKSKKLSSPNVERYIIIITDNPNSSDKEVDQQHLCIKYIEIDKTKTEPSTVTKTPNQRKQHLLKKVQVQNVWI